MGETPGTRRSVLPSFLLRSGALTLTWWILTAGDTTSLALGVPVALIASGLSLKLAPPRSPGFRIAGVPRYAWYFISQSVLGGLDVARRALSPSMPINPALVEYRVSLSSAAARVIFANTISLLPGTLSARIVGDALQVHALDASPSVQTGLRDLETRVGALFGERIAGGERA